MDKQNGVAMNKFGAGGFGGVGAGSVGGVLGGYDVETMAGHDYGDYYDWDFFYKKFLLWIDIMKYMMIDAIHKSLYKIK